MKDYVFIGSSPVDEECVGVTDKKPYLDDMKEELVRFRTMLNNIWPWCGKYNVRLAIMWQQHDFGQYGEIVAYYDDADRVAMECAYYLEDKTPSKWSDTEVVPDPEFSLDNIEDRGDE